MKRGDYDYNHATSGQQFTVLVVLIVMLLLCGVVAGLTLLTSIL